MGIKHWSLFRRWAPQDKWSSHHVQSTASFLSLAFLNNQHFAFSSSPFISSWWGPGACGTIAATRKGKWVPCVWWRAAASVTQYDHGGIAPGIHLLTLGGGEATELELLSPSLCHFVLLPRPSLSAICRRTADSSDKSLKKCGMGPTSTRLATVFWCFGSLLHRDTKRRGVAPSSYCFQRVSVNGKS